jgi:glycosyltransferase involved in cell wall biosynthesis
MNIKARVCMISCTHSLYDDRIYWKEALSLKKHGYDVCHIGVGHENREYISEHGIKLILIRQVKYFKVSAIDKLYQNFFPGRNVYKKILRAAARLKADVYHFHDLQINRIGKKLKALKHNPGVIYDVHEPYPENIRFLRKRNIPVTIFKRLYSAYVNYLELRCSRYYDFVITTEENVNSRFKKYNGENKVDIIYNYTDLGTKYKNIPPDKREYDAIYCGGLTTNRGIFRIIETARIAKMKSRNLKFLIVGPVHEENLKENADKLIREYNLSENVIIKDPVRYDQIPELYNNSRIGLVLLTDNPLYRTALPIKIFEYMAFGLPSVCSNFGHMAKYTTADNTGILVNPANPEEICNAIIEILDNKTVYKKYSENGLRASREKYSWHLMDRKLAEIYSRLV